MANQTIGINIQDRNPYNITTTASGTLIGKDIELVVNLSTVTSRQDVLTALDQFSEYFQSSGIGGPP